MRNGSSQSIALLPELRAFRLALIITMQSRYYYSVQQLCPRNSELYESGVGSPKRLSHKQTYFLSLWRFVARAPLINNL